MMVKEKSFDWYTTVGLECFHDGGKRRWGGGGVFLHRVSVKVMLIGPVFLEETIEKPK